MTFDRFSIDVLVRVEMPNLNVHMFIEFDDTGHDIHGADCYCEPKIGTWQLKGGDRVIRYFIHRDVAALRNIHHDHTKRSRDYAG